MASLIDRRGQSMGVVGIGVVAACGRGMRGGSAGLGMWLAGANDDRQ